MYSMKLVIPFHFMREVHSVNLFSDISRKCILPNMYERGNDYPYHIWQNAPPEISEHEFTHEMKCNGMTTFMEFMTIAFHCSMW